MGHLGQIAFIVSIPFLLLVTLLFSRGVRKKYVSYLSYPSRLMRDLVGFDECESTRFLRSLYTCPSA